MPDDPRPLLPRRIVVEVIDDATAAMFRAMTPAQRVMIASEMHRTVRESFARFVRAGQPNWTQEGVQREVLRMLETIAENEFVPPVIAEK